LFDTTGQQLVFESQYLRLRTSLPESPNLYGLGESADAMRLPTSDYYHTFWNAGEPFLPKNSNLYGTTAINEHFLCSTITNSIRFSQCVLVRILMGKRVPMSKTSANPLSHCP
jgi:hypothetical protein